jgi:hypothetical protein
MAIHYEIRRDPAGWTVFDRWTGQPVVLNTSPKAGLSYPDAERLAEVLNRRRSAGDRIILQ